MVTKEQAIEMYTNQQTNTVSGYTHNEFHQNGCCRNVGPNGGITETIVRVRRSGQTEVWKRSGDWRIPVKYGLYQSLYITPENNIHWHVAANCPLLENTNDKQ